MGMLLGCGDGLFAWRGDWRRIVCPLARADLVAECSGQIAAVDNHSNLLWHGGRLHACDREVEALALWQGHALLLSSDTDCLSLWDDDGLVRTVRAGIYPQDMHVIGDAVHVCSGLDSRLLRYALPDLHLLTEAAIPGMPERISIHERHAYILSMIAEPDVHSALHLRDLRTHSQVMLAQLPGIPGAIHADAQGVWAASSGQLLHYPHDSGEPDQCIEGFGLIRHIAACGSQLLVSDPAAELCVICNRSTVSVLRRGDVGQAIFTA